MTDADLWGHAGYISIFLGMLLLTRRNVWGWAFRFLGELIWVGVGAALGMTSIWLWGVIFMGIDAWGFGTWWRDRYADQDQ